MRKIIYITLNLCIGLGLFLAACNDEEYSVPANEIVDLTFATSQGSITLNWDYAEDTEVNQNRSVEVRYYDLAKQKDVLKTVSGLATSVTIENTRKEYGEYNFSLQPFSMTFAPGNIQTVNGVSEDPVIPDPEPDPEPEPEPDPEPEGPVVDSWEKLVITEADIKIANDDNQEKISPDIYKKILLDGKVNTEELNQVRPWGSATESDIFSIYVTYPKVQRFLKFSYNNMSWSNCRVISELECYVKAEEADDWTLIATLAEKDGLSQVGKGSLSEPKERLAPFEFKYIKLRASKTKKIGTGALTFKTGFGLTEFAVYDVVYTIKK